MKHLAVLAILLLSACSNAHAPGETIRVATAGSTFCIPVARLIKTPSWVPREGTLKDEGFALTGCYWEQRRDSSRSCEDLTSVGSLSISPEAGHAFTDLGSIPIDAFYRTIVSEPDTQMVHLHGTGRIALSNKRLTGRTLYWRLSSTRASSEPSIVTSDDELLFTCERKDGTHLCSRMFNADGLSISYHFGTDEPEAYDVAAQDAEILSFLDGLACNAV